MIKRGAEGTEPAPVAAVRLMWDDKKGCGFI